MREKVEQYIREQGMIQKGDRVVAAVSGGADSVCLLSILAELQGRLGFELRAVHVHHGLRGAEADRDAAFAGRLAEDMGVPCQVIRVNAAAYAKDHGLTVEEAGRELRYAALRQQARLWEQEEAEDAPAGKSAGEAEEETAEKGRRRVWIAAAHQQEDQAETILHHLFRGSGLAGLGGMRPVSGDVIRPLLCVSRREILEYLKEQGLSYCEDSTNASEHYTRNRLRLRVIPEICREINGRAPEHIRQAGEIIRQADAYLEGEADRIWEASGREEEGAAAVPAQVLLGLPDILASYVIRKMIRLQTGAAKDISFGHIRQIRGLAEGRTGSRICLPAGLEAENRYGWIRVSGAAEPLREEGAFQMDVFPLEKGDEIPQKRYTKWFDYDKIRGELLTRTRQTGDYIMLKGGGRKTLKAYMIDEKIPRQERDRIPLLAEGSHILWIVGYRISEYYKVTEATRRVLQVRFYGGEEHGGNDSDSDSGRRSQPQNQ